MVPFWELWGFGAAGGALLQAVGEDGGNVAGSVEDGEEFGGEFFLGAAGEAGGGLEFGFDVFGKIELEHRAGRR